MPAKSQTEGQKCLLTVPSKAFTRQDLGFHDNSLGRFEAAAAIFRSDGTAEYTKGIGNDEVIWKQKLRDGNLAEANYLQTIASLKDENERLMAEIVEWRERFELCVEYLLEAEEELSQFAIRHRLKIGITGFGEAEKV
ncbi:hypothetical protein RUND412_004451 [Rhizina undulata]